MIMLKSTHESVLALKETELKRELAKIKRLQNQIYRYIEELKYLKNKVDKFIIHCTDTKEGMSFSVDTIRQWHTSPNRNWCDIGYHYLIDIDGKILNGRDERLIGSHCQGYNETSIGICYVGGRKSDGTNADTRNEKQKDALTKLLNHLHNRYPNAKVYGHRDFSSKTCPCFDAKDEYKDLFKS